MKIHKRSTPETRRRLSLNLGVLFSTLAVLGLLALAAWGLHELQMSRVAANLIAQVEKAQEEDNWSQAAKLLNSYLLLWPADSIRKVELAETYDKQAETGGQIQRLVALQSVALGVCESRSELKERGLKIRRRMIDRLIQLGRQEEALDEIARIAGSTPDSDLKKAFALSSYQLAVEKRSHLLSSGSQSQLPEWLAQFQSKLVPDQIQNALLDNPGDIELSMSMAECLLGDPEILRNSSFAKDTSAELKERALQVVDRMLSANREDPEAWLAHYMILSQVDRVRAESDIRQALALAPEDASVLKQAGIHYLERARSYTGVGEKGQKQAWLDQAESYFEKVRNSGNSKDVPTYMGYGEVLKEKDKIDEAILVWKDGARVCEPPTIPLRFRIVETLIDAKRFPEALEALGELEESVLAESPQIARFFQNAFVRDTKRLWSAYYVAIGDYRSATAILKQVVAMNKDLERTDQAEIFAFLAAAYFKMGKWDEAGINFEQAVTLSPTVARYQRGAANAWFGAQRFSESLQKLQSIDVKTASDWVMIAEVVLEVQRRQQPDSAMWATFDNALLNARRMFLTDSTLAQSPWLVDFLAIESQVYRSDDDLRGGTIETVSKDIQQLCERFPEADDLWRRAVARLRVWGQNEIALALLSKLSDRAKQSTDAALAQAEALAQNGMASEARRLLETRLLDDPDNELLKKTLVQWRAAEGEWEGAMTEMRRVAGKDINIVRALAEMAVRTPVLDRELDLGNATLVAERMKKWNDNLEMLEKEMRSLEGEDGTEWRYLRGKRLLVGTALQKESNLSEVDDLCSYLDRNRPMWTATHVLAGNLAERQGKSGVAIKSYNRAIQYGEQDLEVFERLADLLYRQGALAEASALLDRLGNRASRSRDLSLLTLTINRDKRSDVLGFAKQGTEARPNDPMAWMWYGQALEVNSREFPENKRKEALDEAKKSFEKAKEISDGGDIRVLAAELNFFKLIGDQQKVSDLLSGIRSSSKIDPAIKWLAIANISQSLGLMEEAEEAYKESLRSGGDKLEIGRRVAQLYLVQGRRDDAIDQLQKVYDEEPNNAETKRSLASLLADRGATEDWNRVEKLLSNDKGVSNADDRRLRAELLLQKGGPAELAQAQYLLEGLVEDPNNRTDEDRFRLASVYLTNAKRIESQTKDQSQVRQLTTAAGQQLKLAANGSQSPPEYIYAYGDFLLEQGRYQEAIQQSERLTLAAPEEFSSALLKARVEAAGDKTEDAKNTILTWLTAKTLNKAPLKEPKVRAMVLVQAGQAMDLLGHSDDAERLLREAFELDVQAGENYVQSLARSKDTVARNRAIKYLVEKVRRDRSAGTAKLLANLLSAGRFDQELEVEGEAALLGIESSNLDDTDLLLAVADMWLAQNKVDRAIETYRRIVRLQPGVVALNNLANLLAEQPGGSEEALAYIDQAISIAGKQPLLLDTKGVILMASGRLDDAIPFFENATRASEDPRLALHLYLSLSQAGRVEEAMRARSKINVEELSRSLLTPSERLELTKLQQIVD
ncbi:MAG: tetratricopeptide repeat protein [Pirellula sp.]